LFRTGTSGSIATGELSWFSIAKVKRCRKVRRHRMSFRKVRRHRMSFEQVWYRQCPRTAQHSTSMILVSWRAKPRDEIENILGRAFVVYLVNCLKDAGIGRVAFTPRARHQRACKTGLDGVLSAFQRRDRQ
jgi:hypothetical protein